MPSARPTVAQALKLIDDLPAAGLLERIDQLDKAEAARWASLTRRSPLDNLSLFQHWHTFLCEHSELRHEAQAVRQSLSSVYQAFVGAVYGAALHPYCAHRLSVKRKSMTSVRRRHLHEHTIRIDHYPREGIAPGRVALADFEHPAVSVALDVTDKSVTAYVTLVLPVPLSPIVRSIFLKL